MDKKAYVAKVSYVLHGIKNNKAPQDETHAVNSILALTGLAGAGLINNKATAEYGGAALGASAGGALGYHGARLLDLNKALRAIIGIGGAIAGGWVGGKAVRYGDSTPSIDVLITNGDSSKIPVTVSGAIENWQRS